MIMDCCPVFCIADIPTTTLDLLLQGVEEYLSEFDSPGDIAEASQYLVIMDTKDIATITQGSSHPMTSSPTTFLGLSLKEVHEWFITNINQPRSKKFTPDCFLVLDNKSIEEHSCVFVCTLDSAPGEIHSLRCVFNLVYQHVIACDVQGRSIEDNEYGYFMRSGVTMTEENYSLYISDEEELDQAYVERFPNDIGPMDVDDSSYAEIDHNAAMISNVFEDILAANTTPSEKEPTLALEGSDVQLPWASEVEESSRPSKRKRVPATSADAASALEPCECGFDATLNGQPLVKCTMAKCMTQWYHLQCINLEKAPRNWVCWTCEEAARGKGGKRPRK